WDRDDNSVAGRRHTAGARRAARGTENASPRGMKLYILRNRRGLEAWITSYGASLVALYVPDRYGRRADVVLGFDHITGYVAPHPAIGAIVGRVANRIANARFTLDDTTYALSANDGAHHLHGGWCGLGRVVWDATCADSTVRLRHRSEAGSEGYPGNLDVV